MRTEEKRLVSARESEIYIYILIAEAMMFIS